MLSDRSFSDSQNPEGKQLHDKASMLAAWALTDSTKTNYGKAWAWFLDFCDKMGYNPMEASGQDIATWLVFRSEQTSSPNVLEANLKVIKFLGTLLTNLFGIIPLQTLFLRVS